MAVTFKTASPLFRFTSFASTALMLRVDVPCLYWNVCPGYHAIAMTSAVYQVLTFQCR